MISQTSNKPYFSLNDKLFKQAFMFYATNDVALRDEFNFFIVVAFELLWSHQSITLRPFRYILPPN